MLTGLDAIAAAAATGSGPGITRERGRQLAQRELARSIYKPSAWSRIWRDIVSWLASLAAHGSAGRPGWLGVALLTAGLVVVLAAGLWLAGPARVSRRSRRPAVEGRPMSAARYRLAADQHASAGDYPAAITARFRAIAVDLEQRGILPPRPGRTAAELGDEAASAIPAEAVALASAARLFDDVRYGGRPGSPSGYRQLRDLDLRVATAAAAVTAPALAASRQAGLPPASMLPGTSDSPRPGR